MGRGRRRVGKGISNDIGDAGCMLNSQRKFRKESQLSLLPSRFGWGEVVEGGGQRFVISEEEEFEQAKFRAHIFSKNDQVTVELVNDSIDQAKFIAMEWTGLYFDVARKYG